jgi:hypothetical protein
MALAASVRSSIPIRAALKLFRITSSSIASPVSSRQPKPIFSIYANDLDSQSDGGTQDGRFDLLESRGTQWVNIRSRSFVFRSSLRQVRNTFSYSPGRCSWPAVNRKRASERAQFFRVHSLFEWAGILGIKFPRKLNTLYLEKHFHVCQGPRKQQS